MTNAINIPGTRVNYIEPNYTLDSFETMDNEGKSMVEMPYPLEDYCIYVSLSAEIRGRSIRLMNNRNLKVEFLTKPDGAQTVNWLQGTDFSDKIDDKVKSANGNYRYLTSNYTDIFIDDTFKGSDNPSTAEWFGIDSVDISFNNYMVPEITIVFTDIRGASLMSAEEASHYVTKDGVGGIRGGNLAGSFFRGFFTFPYPKYTLVVKGFYGQPVSYEMTVSDFRVSFNADSGNFKATAKFIGYSYSYLSDVMFNALCAAPYSDFVGKDYWDAHTKGENPDWFCFKENRQPAPMPTLGQVLYLYNKAKHEGEKAANDSDVAVESQKFTEKKDKIINIKKLLREYSDIILENFEKTQADELGTNTEENNTVIDSKIEDGIIRYAIFYGWKNNTPSRVVNENLKKKIDEKIGQLNSALNGIVSNPNVTNFLTNLQEFKDDSLPDDIVQNIDNIQDRYSTYKRNNVLGAFYLFRFNDVFGFNYDLLKRESDEIDKDIQKVNKEVSELKKHAIAKSLGFNPTLENVMRIIMAHFETFTHIIGDGASRIMDQGKNGDRTPKKLLGVNISDSEMVDTLTDIPKNVLLQQNSDAFIPPFPKLTRKITETLKQSIEETWVGEYPGYWVEEDIVNGLFNGVSEFAKVVSSAENVIAEFENSSQGGFYVPIPVFPTDVILEDNPWGKIDFSNFDDFAGHVVLRFMCGHGAYFKNNYYKINDDDIENIGKIDAYNFYRLHPNVPDEFKQILKENPKVEKIDDVLVNQVNEQSLVDKANEIIKIASGVSSNHPWSINANGSLIRESGENYEVCYKIDDKQNTAILPFQGLSFDDINRELGKPNYRTPRDTSKYIVLRETKTKLKNQIIINSGSNYKKYVNACKDLPSNVKIGENEVEIGNPSSGLVKSLSGEMFMPDGLFNDNKSAYAQNVKLNYVCANSNASFIFGETGYVLPQYKPTLDDIKNAVNIASEKQSEILDKYRITPFINSKFIGKSIFNGKVEFHELSDSYDIEKHSEGNYNVSDVTLSVIPGTMPVSGVSKSSYITDRRSSYITDMSNIDSTLFARQWYYNLNNNLERSAAFLQCLGNGLFNYKYLIGVVVGNVDNPPISLVVPYGCVLYLGLLCYASMLKDNQSFKIKGDSEVDFKKLANNSGIGKLSTSIRIELSEKFVKWSNNVYPSIHSSMSLTLVGGKYTSIDKFFEDLISKDYKFISNDENNIVYKLSENLNANFFENYIGILFNGNKAVLINRERSYGAKTVTEEVLRPCVMLTPANHFRIWEKDKPNCALINTQVKKTRLENYVRYFIKSLADCYNINKELSEESTSKVKSTKDPESTTDMKIALYRYCKLLYDKWLQNENFYSENNMEKFFGSKSDIIGTNIANNRSNQMFYFVDQYYNFKGDDIIINLDEFIKTIVEQQTSDQYTLLSFISNMSELHKCNFFCINNFKHLGNIENLSDVFRPVPYIEMKEPDSTPNFIFVNVDEPSSKLSMEDPDYRDDGFILGPSTNDIENIPYDLRSESHIGYEIPAFGVTYGKQSQSFFKDIEVSMDNPITTEQSIKAQYAIASMNSPEKNTDNGSETGSESKFVSYGQDLFTVYSNNSYTASVTMMGCAWIQPLMYFVLQNVPMFRGTYLIQKVTHHIEQGNMVTRFIGTRMANTATRKTTENGVSKTPSYDGNEGELLLSRKYNAADVNNTCPYKVYPVFGDMGGKGGSISKEILDMTFAQFSETLSSKQKINWPSPNMYSKVYSTKVSDVLMMMAMAETGYSNKDSNMFGSKTQPLMTQLNLVVEMNRFNSGVYKTVFGVSQVGMDNLSDNGISGKKKYDDIYPLLESAREVLYPVLENGPAYLVGKVSLPAPKKEVLEVYRRQRGTKRATEHVLTLENLQRMYMYCTLDGYDFHCTTKAEKAAVNPQGWWEGDFICQEKGHVYSSCGDNGKIEKKFWEPESSKSPSQNEKGQEINNFLSSFTNAVHMTSMNTPSVHENFGIQNINGSKCVLNRGKSATLSKTFDILLNTPEYFKYIKTLKWVVGNDNKLKCIKLELSEDGKPILNNQVVGYVVDNLEVDKITFDSNDTVFTIPDNIGSKDVLVQHVSENYLLSVAKFIKTGNPLSIIKSPTFSEEMLSWFNITDCESIVPNEGLIGAPVFTGEVSDNVYIDMAEVCSNCNTLDSKKLDTSYVLKRDGGHGCCTSGPSTWYKRGFAKKGFNCCFNSDNWWIGPTGVHNKTGTKMGNYGFRLIYSTSNTSIESVRNWLKTCELKPGDIVTMLAKHQNGTFTTHGEMWTGLDWRSDFIQNDSIPYSNELRVGSSDGRSLCVWRFDDNLFEEQGWPSKMLKQGYKLPQRVQKESEVNRLKEQNVVIDWKDMANKTSSVITRENGMISNPWSK